MAWPSINDRISNSCPPVDGVRWRTWKTNGDFSQNSARFIQQMNESLPSWLKYLLIESNSELDYYFFQQYSYGKYAKQRRELSKKNNLSAFCTTTRRASFLISRCCPHGYRSCNKQCNPTFPTTHSPNHFRAPFQLDRGVWRKKEAKIRKKGEK